MVDMHYPVQGSYALSPRDWVGSLLLFPLCIYYLFERGEYTILDSTAGMVHQGGHVLFGLMGPAAGKVGGLLLQVLLPAGLVGYFWFHHYRFGVQVFLFWLGQNLIYLSTYAASPGYGPYGRAAFAAEARHDWLYLLGRLELVQYDLAFGSILLGLGALCFLTLLFLPGYMER